MPGPKVDRAFNEALAKLNDEKLAKTRGVDVFNDVENNKNLTAREKQEVHQRLGKACMQQEVDTAGNHPETLLRLQTAQTNYITAFLKEYAKDYKQAVLDSAVHEAQQVKIPDDPGLRERFPVLGNPRDPGSRETPQTLTALENEATDLGSRMIKAHDDNLHLMSPQALEFLRVSMEPVQALNDPVMTGRAMSSTIMLKLTGPDIATLAMQMGGSQQKTENLTESEMQANMLMQGGKVMLTFANNSHKPPGSQLGVNGKKAQDVMAEKLLTAENLDRINGGYSEIATGEISKRVTLHRLDDRIDVLKAKKDHLEHHATVGDKIKAFFKHGLEGVDGEVAKINKKIDATQHARDDVDADVSVEQRQKELDQLKDKQATLAQEKQNAKGVLLMKNMEASGMNVGSTVSDKAVKEARDTYAKVKPEQKDLAKEIKAKEKVLSVREKLGPKTGGTGKSQDLGHNHGV